LGLRFRCLNCGNVISVKYLRVGDLCKCPICNQQTTVGNDAEEIVDSSANLEPFGSKKYVADPSAKPLSQLSKPEAQAGVIAMEIEEKLRLEKKFYASISWFFWIAGLSFINSILFVTNANISFTFGLGITQIIDVFGMVLAEERSEYYRYLTFALILLATGIFALMGYFARQRKRWAIIVGLVLYALDSIILLTVQYWIGFLFHIFVIIMISMSFGHLLQLEQLETEQKRMAAVN